MVKTVFTVGAGSRVKFWKISAVGIVFESLFDNFSS